MSRFQAQTNAVLTRELDDLREKLGLRPSQKADLLREIAMLASWVVQQASAGRRIEARRGQKVLPLDSPIVTELIERHDRDVPGRLVLDEGELARLRSILARPFSPAPALRKMLARLSVARRRAPSLRWPDSRG